MRLTIAVLVAAVAPLQAQVAPSRPGACFRGAPAARCTWYPLIEAGISDRVTRPEPGDESLLFSWNLGFMVNRSPNTAIGGALFAAAEEEGGRAGVMFRYRRWIGPRTSIDLGAGATVIGATNNDGTVMPGSPMVQARFNLGDLVAATARLDVLKLSYQCFGGANCRPDRVSPQFYLGAELGSWAGIPGYAASLLGAVLLLVESSVVID